MAMTETKEPSYKFRVNKFDNAYGKMSKHDPIPIRCFNNTWFGFVLDGKVIKLSEPGETDVAEEVLWGRLKKVMDKECNDFLNMDEYEKKKYCNCDGYLHVTCTACELREKHGATTPL